MSLGQSTYAERLAISNMRVECAITDMRETLGAWRCAGRATAISHRYFNPAHLPSTPYSLRSAAAGEYCPWPNGSQVLHHKSNGCADTFGSFIGFWGFSFAAGRLLASCKNMQAAPRLQPPRWKAWQGRLVFFNSLVVKLSSSLLRLGLFAFASVHSFETCPLLPQLKHLRPPASFVACAAFLAFTHSAQRIFVATSQPR